jgi:hypothetical protein
MAREIEERSLTLNNVLTRLDDARGDRMATDGESRIDPRYHPAFQRGFQPKPATERVREREFQSTIAERSAVQPAADLRVSDHWPDAPSGPDSSIGVVPAMGSVEVVADAEAELAHGLPRVRRLNPYYFGLWIAGILSIVASGALASLPRFWNAGIDQGSAPWMQAVQLAAYLLPGPLATVGLAIVIGLVFVKASALRKGRA